MRQRRCLRGYQLCVCVWYVLCIVVYGMCVCVLSRKRTELPQPLVTEMRYAWAHVGHWSAEVVTLAAGGRLSVVLQAGYALQPTK